MDTPAIIQWLNEAARYFEARPIAGEDSAHWANVYNAENCRKIAAEIEHLQAAAEFKGSLLHDLHEAREEIKRLQAESSALAAGVCEHRSGDEHGNPWCGMVKRPI